MSSYMYALTRIDVVGSSTLERLVRQARHVELQYRPLGSIYLITATLLVATGCSSSVREVRSPATLSTEVHSQPSAGDVIAQVVSVYRPVVTFVSKFKETLVLKEGSVAKAAEGSVSAKQPGFISWSYDSPQGNRLFSDGKYVRLYLPAKQEMRVEPVEVSAMGAFSFLTQTDRWPRLFDMRLSSDESHISRLDWLLVGIPAVPNPAYNTVVFYVDKTSFHIHRVVVVDFRGNRDQFDFLTPMMNVNIDPERFNVEAPIGTVVHN